MKANHKKILEQLKRYVYVLQHNKDGSYYEITPTNIVYWTSYSTAKKFKETTEFRSRHSIVKLLYKKNKHKLFAAKNISKPVKLNP